MNTNAQRALWLFTAALTLLAGCGTTEIASRWRGGNPGLSGSGGWRPASSSRFDDRRMSGAVSNDSEYIYIELRTVNRDLQRLVVREGITWWFDGQGGGKKSFGIHYPVGAPGQRPPEGAGGQEGALPPAERSMDRPMDRPVDREEPVTAPTELELFNGENEHQRMSILATGGIDARFRRQRDTLVYELRVPLSAGAAHPFGIGVNRGALLGLGAVTSALRGTGDLPVDRQGAEGEGEGGFGGRRGGGRGRTGSRPDGGPRNEPLNLWMKVRLATGE